MKPQWYNYNTGLYEDSSILESDERALSALPLGQARNVYSLHRVMGLSIADALIKVREVLFKAYKQIGEQL